MGGFAATVTPPLTHLCLLQHHEKPWSVEHGLQCPGKIPHGPTKSPPAAQHIIHLLWINIRACSPLLPPSWGHQVLQPFHFFVLEHAALHHLFLRDMRNLHFSLC